MSDLDRRGFFRLLAGAAAMAMLPIPLPPVVREIPLKDWRFAIRIANIDISDLIAVYDVSAEGEVLNYRQYEDGGNGYYIPKREDPA